MNPEATLAQIIKIMFLFRVDSKELDILLKTSHISGSNVWLVL